MIKSIDVHEPRPVSPVRAIASPPSSSSHLPSTQTTSTSLTSPAGWASPAFLRRREERFRPAIRPAFTAPADPLPFSTDEILQEELDNQKPRKRTKFGRKSGEWKFAREGDRPDYTQHDLTGMFDVEMIEREIDAAEERENGLPVRGGQGVRRSRDRDRWAVPDFGLDGSSTSRPRPFVEAEGFERIIEHSVREAQPAVMERAVAEDARVSAVDGVQAEGPKLSNDSMDAPDEVEDRGDQTSIVTGQKPERPTEAEEGEGGVVNIQDNDHKKKNELDTRNEDGGNDEAGDEDNDEDEHQDDTNDETTKHEEQKLPGDTSRKQQLPTVANEEQEITVARPLIPTITATEEVTQANAQLQAELASQLGEHVVVEGDWIRTNDMMETLNAPEDNEEDLRSPVGTAQSELHADTPPGIPEIPQAAQTNSDTMDQDDAVDRPIGPLKVPDEVVNVADASVELETSSSEPPGFDQETVETPVMPTKEDSEIEVPAIVTPQTTSANDTAPDVGMVSQHGPDNDAIDVAGNGSNLEDNALPIVISEDEPSLSEVLETEEQPTSDTMLHELDDASRSFDDVVESVLEIAATEEIAKAVITMPITEWTLQTSPAFEAQDSLEIASPVVDYTKVDRDGSGHQEEPIEIEELREPQEESASAATLPPQDDESTNVDVIESVVEPDLQEEAVNAVVPTASGDSILPRSPALEAPGGPEDPSFDMDITEFSMDESSHQEEAHEIEGPNEAQELSVSVVALEPEQNVLAVAEDVDRAQSVLDARGEPASSQYLQREDVTSKTTQDIIAKTVLLEAMTDDQLLQEGQSLLAELEDEDQQMPDQLGATPTSLPADTTMILSDGESPQEAPAHRLSAFEVMQSRLNRPVAPEAETPPLLADGIQDSEGSSSEEEMPGDGKEPSVVISLVDDSADPEDDEVEYDDVPSVAEAASSYGSKDSEESFTGFDDEERPDIEAAIVDQDSVLGSEIDQRPDVDLASFEQEPLTEFEDEDEVGNEERVSPDSGLQIEVEDGNEEEYGVQDVNVDMEVNGEISPALVTAEKTTLDETVDPRLDLDPEEEEDEDDEVVKQVHKDIAKEDFKSQRKDEDIYEDDDKAESEYDEFNEEVREDMVDVDSKSEAKDNDIFEDDEEDEELPELDFKLIPTLDKPLVAALRAVNNAVSASSARDTSVPKLQDEDEGVDTHIADTGTGARHTHGVNAVDDAHPGSGTVHATPHEETPFKQAEVDLQVPRREPQKRSSSRKSNVPSELKGWFSPRESLQDGNKNDLISFEKEVEVSHDKGMDYRARRPSLPSSFNTNGQPHSHRDDEEQHAEPSSSAPVAGSRPIKHSVLVPRRLGDEALKLVGGLHTSLSYYTPLTDLQIHTNSQSEHDSVVDVLAVVSSFTAKAKRATSGPKDHFTTFHITTPTPRTDFSPVEVQVFRPRKEVLPMADVGDVALLRNFVVRSNKGRSFLLSTAGSAWCVWRYAKKERLDLKNVGEECLGPPVEIGAEERQRSQELSSWWKNEKENEADADARPVFRWSWRASD